jgi:hypothetical protein
MSKMASTILAAIKDAAHCFITPRHGPQALHAVRPFTELEADPSIR